MDAVRSRSMVATPEQVWTALAAFDRISTWAPDVDHSSYATEQTEGEGTTRRVQAGRLVLLEQVTEWDPPHALAYRLEGVPLVAGATNRWTLVPQGDRTLVTLTSTVEPGSPPLGRVAGSILLRRLAKASESMLAGLSAHLGGTP